MDAKDYFEQGYDKQILKQFSEAIEDYNKVLELDKNFERAYVQRAFCKVQLKDYESAITDFESAIKLNPKDPISYLNLGFVYYNLGNKEDTTYFDKAIEIDEKMAEAYFMRGQVFLNKDENELAVLDFTKVIEIEPTWTAYYLSRSIAYDRLNEYEKALDDCLKIKQIDPNYTNIDEYIRDFKKELQAAST